MTYFYKNYTKLCYWTLPHSRSTPLFSDEKWTVTIYGPYASQKKLFKNKDILLLYHQGAIYVFVFIWNYETN